MLHCSQTWNMTLFTGKASLKSTHTEASLTMIRPMHWATGGSLVCFYCKCFQMTQFSFLFFSCFSALCWISVHGSTNLFPSSIFYLLSLRRGFWKHFLKKLFQLCGHNFSSSRTGFISITSQFVKTLLFIYFFQFYFYVYVPFSSLRNSLGLLWQ